MPKRIKNIIFLVLVFMLPAVVSFAPDDVKTFRDSNSTIYLQMPSDWKIQLHEDDHTVQMFISKEQELFTAGLIITKIYNVSSFYKVPGGSDSELVNFWNNRLVQASQHYTRTENVSSNRHNCGSYAGMKKEAVIQYNEHLEPVHTYTLILANKGNIITLVAVAPENQWAEYKNIFDAAIQSLELK